MNDAMSLASEIPVAQRVLFIAPEPFFSERGTPLNVRALAESLSELGFVVDLLVYPIGQDIEIPGVRIIRGFGFPGIRDVPAGPSWRKIVLDIGLTLRGLPYLLSRSYSVFHGIEEGAFIGGFFGMLRRVPFVVDMDSCMSSQLEASGFIRSTSVLKFFCGVENFFIRRAAGILTVCAALTKKANLIVDSVPIHQIEDCPISSASCVDSGEVEKLREQFGVQGRRVVVYTGNFQSYQGLDLLLQSCRFACDNYDHAKSLKVILVGGDGQSDPLVAECSRKIEQMGLSDVILCTGPLPIDQMGNVMALADLLVSPRSTGGNTPLKIYTYMASGRPILATDMETHSQVLDSETALLASPDPESFGRVLAEALASTENAKSRLNAIGRRAKLLVEEKYSKDSFVRRVGEFYQELLGDNNMVNAVKEDTPPTRVVTL